MEGTPRGSGSLGNPSAIADQIPRAQGTRNQTIHRPLQRSNGRLSTMTLACDGSLRFRPVDHLYDEQIASLVDRLPYMEPWYSQVGFGGANRVRFDRSFTGWYEQRRVHRSRHVGAAPTPYRSKPGPGSPPSFAVPRHDSDRQPRRRRSRNSPPCKPAPCCAPRSPEFS